MSVIAIIKRVREKKDCICNGYGWTWGHELPAGRADHETDTRYSCPYCAREVCRICRSPIYDRGRCCEE